MIQPQQLDKLIGLEKEAILSTIKEELNSVPNRKKCEYLKTNKEHIDSIIEQAHNADLHSNKHKLLSIDYLSELRQVSDELMDIPLTYEFNAEQAKETIEGWLIEFRKGQVNYGAINWKGRKCVVVDMADHKKKISNSRYKLTTGKKYN